MKKFANYEELIQFAITLEEKAESFYLNLANIATQPAVKNMCKELAQEEHSHKVKLEEVITTQGVNFDMDNVMDLKMTELMDEVTKDFSELSYQEALAIAMKREKFSHDLYVKLSQEIENASLKDTFRFLAKEELKHKHKIEIEYDDVVLKYN